MMGSNVCWDNALTLIRENIGVEQFNTWFKPIVFDSFNQEKRQLLVKVPSPFVYEYLEANYLDLLRKVLRKTFGDGVQLGYRVVTDKEHNLTQDLQADTADTDIKQRTKTRANQPLPPSTRRARRRSTHS